MRGDQHVVCTDWPAAPLEFHTQSRILPVRARCERQYFHHFENILNPLHQSDGAFLQSAKSHFRRYHNACAETIMLIHRHRGNAPGNRPVFIVNKIGQSVCVQQVA